MAADLIVIDRASKQRGNSTVRLANLIREVREIADALSDAANHGVDNADYSLLEAEFGLETGKGANFATLLGYMQEIFNSDADVAGAARLARIDEFCARVAGQ